MGNPAGVRKKKREKRRKRFEARMQGLAYVPKELRAQILADEQKDRQAAPAAAK